jgi:hypothetical protein
MAKTKSPRKHFLTVAPGVFTIENPIHYIAGPTPTSGAHHSIAVTAHVTGGSIDTIYADILNAVTGSSVLSGRATLTSAGSTYSARVDLGDTLVPARDADTPNYIAVLQCYYNHLPGDTVRRSFIVFDSGTVVGKCD